MREEQWLMALRGGRLDWFPELVEAYRARVYALCHRAVGPVDAEDLAQDIFLLIYRCLPSFRGDSSLSTWLYRVALNKAKSAVRQRAAARWLSFSAHPPERADSADADERLLRDERRDEVHRALQRLKAREREVLELFYFQRLPQTQIAEILGLSPRGVETRLRRARARMHRALTGREETNEEDGDEREGLLEPAAQKLH